MSSLTEFYKRIDREKEKLIEEVRAFLRMPSISGTGEGIEETASFLRDLLTERLDASINLERYGGHPILYGYVDVGAEKTMVYYNMYDVQPVDPIDKWVSPPFEAGIIDDKIVARGAYNTKGALLSGILGMEVYYKMSGKLPMNVCFILEGEEELGSPSMPKFVNDKKEELVNTDVCLFSFPTETIIGKPKIILGNKGIIFVELRVKTSEYDVHSSYGRGLYNPAIILSRIVSSMVDPLEGPIVDWLNEDVITPTPNDLKYLDEIIEAAPVEILKELYGIHRTRLENKELYIDVFFKPNINVDGFSAGYTGPGTKTIVPANGILRLDFRLVPDMNPEKVIEKFVNHLKKIRLYEYVELKVHDYYPWSKTDPDGIAAESARRAYKLLGKKSYTIPILPGSAPTYLFTNILGIDCVAAGPGHGGRAHAPNEYITLDTIPGIAKYTVTFMEYYSKLSK
jgi:acetylornithine deacetylase/succinyl-diaminopimelate desuccinylase-like protein